MGKAIAKEQLIAAGRELNKLLFDPDDPQIGVAEDEDVMKSQILEATELLTPDDDISEETQALIKQLTKPITEKVQEEEGKEPEKEKEVDIMQLIKAAERIKDLKGVVEESPTFKELKKKMYAGAYKVEGGLALLKKEMMRTLKGETVEQTPVASPAAAKKDKNGNGKTKTMKKEKITAAKKEKKNQPIRVNIVFDCITSEPQTADEICKKANKKVVELNGKDNIKQTIHIFKTQISLLEYVGLVIKDKDGKYHRT